MTLARVLMLERSRARAAGLARALAAHGEIHWEWTANPGNVGDLLAAHTADALLADWDLLGGADAVRHLVGCHPTTPVIVVSGRITQEDVVACLKAGARDCVRRDNPTRIHAAVSEALDRAALDAEEIFDGVQYRERLDDLIRSERARAEFIGHLSHELRTPLNVIIGYSDMLVDGAFGDVAPEQQSVIGKISHQACELLELVDTTLELSRIEAGRVPLQVEPVDVAALAAEIAEETRVLIDGKRIEMRSEFPAGVEQPQTDPAKLKVVIKNLVTNALKFTEQGSVSISGRNLRDGIEIAVTDTGPGIPAHQRTKIFEAFEQGDSARGQRGAGLGLHIVRRLLAVLGGGVSLDSKVGVGSTFRIWIPLQQPVGARDQRGVLA